MLSSSSIGGGASIAEIVSHDVKSFEGSPADRLHNREDDEVEASGAEGQFMAMLMQGFFSPVSAMGSDPDGAGGALTLGPASEASSAMMFKIKSDPDLVSV